MTMISAMSLRCRKCGRENRVPKYSSVNVARNDLLKAQLLSGDLLRWKCGGCGVGGENDYPLLYHDMAQRILIQWVSRNYAPTVQALSAALPPASASSGLPPHYRVRVVREFADLTEKIRVFDAGLDDRVIEWQKHLQSKRCERLESLRAPLGPAVEFVPPRFQHCTELNGQRHMEFTGPIKAHVDGYPEFPLTTHAPEAMYQRAVLHLDALLPLPDPVNGCFYLVDQAYIERAWHRLPDITAPTP
jgi:hypothetical protein